MTKKEEIIEKLDELKSFLLNETNIDSYYIQDYGYVYFNKIKELIEDL